MTDQHDTDSTARQWTLFPLVIILQVIQPVIRNGNRIGQQLIGDFNQATEDIFSEAVFGFLADIINGLQDFLRDLADGARGIEDLFNILPDIIQDILGIVFNAIGLFLDLLAGAAGFFGGLMEVVQTSEGLVAAAVLLGAFTLASSFWLVFSGIPEGEVLVFSSWENDAYLGMVGTFVGLGLMMTSVSRLGGVAMIAGAAVVSLFFGIQADEAEFVVGGIFAAIFGFPTLFSLVGLGLVTAGIASIVVTAAFIYGNRFLEYRGARYISGE